MAKRGAQTIEDVARVAGVSRQTVSRVLNNGPSVRPVVRERILAAIEELGYVPSLAARRMGSGKSFLILAINDRARTIENWSAGRGNDWVDQMLHGGMLTCEGLGYHLLFELVDTDPAKAIKAVDGALSSLRPDGVILTPPHSENAGLAALLTKRGIPFGRMGSSSRHNDGINVFMSDHAAAVAAVEHLVALDHRRIAFISGSANYAASNARERGYIDGLAAAGLSAPTGYIQHGDFSFASGVEAAERLLALREQPTAVIVSNDEMAFAALHVARNAGIAVPGALSVVSFDDTPGVRFSMPPLTAIRQPISALAAKLCTALVRASGGDDLNGDYVLPFELIERQSTARCST
ncbi:LacI family DNA-binding transcriptional regulator [Sphingomonas sp. MMS24-J45]|uniref:LacI family DNA-binding transcriptional regulator n=1 Tax=Sphingomonas sp. MMS24-J45 TaxID=3238806 RepID=UPI00384DBE19